jgi:hypothetical protein
VEFIKYPMREIFIYLFECNGMEWNGMEWNGMEWNGMSRSGYYQILTENPPSPANLPLQYCRVPTLQYCRGVGKGRGKRRGICLFRSPALQYCRGV